MPKSWNDRISRLETWTPPPGWLRITTLDLHTAGEPLRIVTGGLPDIPGRTILEKRRHLKENLDHMRTALMFEPRGHADMYGCILTPPVNAGSDFGAIFLHNEGYSTMCGHAILALTYAAVATGMIENREPLTVIRIDTPAGRVTSFARVAEDRIESVFFRNVPSFVLEADRTVDVPGLGPIRVDVAYGGAFYAFVDADALGIPMTPENVGGLIRTGMAVKRAVSESLPIEHPFEKDLGFLYGTIFTGKGHTPGTDSRNVCIFAQGEVDRSPTGTGVSARMALHFARGDIGIDRPMTIESLIGTRFIGQVVETVTFGGRDAVIPQVEGHAHFTGRNDFFIDPADALKNGFILR